MIPPFALRFVPDRDGNWDVQIDAPAGLSTEDAVRQAFFVLAAGLIDVEPAAADGGGPDPGEVVHEGGVVISGYHTDEDASGSLQAFLGAEAPFGSTPKRKSKRKDDGMAILASSGLAASPSDMLEVGRALTAPAPKKRCSVCRQPGHGLDRCKDLAALRRARQREVADLASRDRGHLSSPEQMTSARLRSLDQRIREVRGATVDMFPSR